MMNKKVSLARCENYNLEDVKNAIKKNIDNIGGLKKYVESGERVLLKVNLLMKKKPEDAVTTHPTFVRALAEIFIENGNDVLIGDSPGGAFNERILTSLYSATGYSEIAEKTNAKLNFNVKSSEKETPNGFVLKKMVITDMLNDVDKVISVSKLKTHGMMTFTGAVKNMFGTIPGIMKAEYHLNMPEYDTFADAMIDICINANPILSFMDGIEGMEGDGPSSGDKRNVNVVITSESPYHLDKVACKIIDLDFQKVPIIKNCIKRGICKEGLLDIELLGDDISSFKLKDFKIPETRILNPTKNMPKAFSDIINKFLQPKPVFDYELCIKCGVCAENCPAKVIDMSAKKPIVDLSNCIRCYCCQELCPKKSVKIHRPAILKYITGK